MTLDSLIFNAGALFFALWTAAVAAVTITAFGRDLLPWRAELDPADESHPADHLRPPSRTVL
jgi:hypothetical protein